MSAAAISRQEITGLILSGGRASRMGGVDKGLQTFRGASLTANAVQRLRPQVSDVLISANRNLSVYRALGTVIEDSTPGFAGPLAGILTALQTAQTPFVACVPCDSPFFPLDLVERLSAPFLDPISGADCDIAIALAPDSEQEGRLRSHPVFALIHRRLAAPLADALARGERRLNAWRSHHNAVEVPFPDEQAFYNINTLQALSDAR